MQELWYVRRGEEVKGPFPSNLIRRFILLGRTQDTDELSTDQETWQELADIRQRFVGDVPAGDRDAPGVVSEDERSGVDRRLADRDAPVDRRTTDRRRPEPERVQRRRARRQAMLEARRPRRNPLRDGLVVSAILAVIVGAGVAFRPAGDSSDPDCAAAPRPGVDWSNCWMEEARLSNVDLAGAKMRSARLREANLLGVTLTGADMAYSELVRANISHGDLRGASLMGANLQRADLAYADLRDADLAYADLSGANLGGAAVAGARLDYAIWVDGVPCAPGSNGRCIAAVEMTSEN